jgi:hypothetical protein
VDCKRVEGELVAFELSAIDGATRAGLEAHLVGCSRCVGQYLALKRAVDAAEESGERPSEVLRARLRRDVDDKLHALPSDGATRFPREDGATRLPREDGTRAQAAMLRAGRRRARVALGVAALAMLMIAPFAWHRAQPQPSPGAPGLHAPPPHYDEPLVPVEQVDTARTTPENLRFL